MRGKTWWPLGPHIVQKKRKQLGGHQVHLFSNRKRKMTLWPPSSFIFQEEEKKT